MKKKKKVAGWSTKMLEEVTSRREVDDTVEMVQWRSINQEEADNLWNDMSGKMEEGVFEKCKVEEAKKTKGVVSCKNGKLSRKREDIGLGHRAKIVGARIFRGTACSGAKACRQVKQKRWGANSNEWRSWQGR